MIGLGDMRYVGMLLMIGDDRWGCKAIRYACAR